MNAAAPTHSELSITRVFAAPRADVYRAWLDPDEVAAWYGPNTFDVPRDRVDIDARAGGRWEVTMIPRGGGDGYVAGYEILELVEPELIVMRSDPMPAMGMPDGTVVRIELHEHDGGTRMVLTDGPMPVEGCQRAEGGYRAAFDKLEARLVA